MRDVEAVARAAGATQPTSTSLAMREAEWLPERVVDHVRCAGETDAEVRGSSMKQPRKVIRGRVRPPPLPTPLVSRPRLERLLRGLVESCPMVCIYATAGSGKTTAVLQATQECGRPLAWLSADRTDASPGQLLTYLEAALAVVVPAVDGVATGALAAGVPHVEAAGLLAEEIGEVPVLLVLDDLERLFDADAARDVLAAFLRYLPATARTVLIGRCELSIDFGSAAIGRVAGIGEAELAFTLEEATQALAAAGSDVDASTALAATDGWVAGVLFEAWRSAEHVPGIGGEADPLYGYLSSQILDALAPAERDLLVVTSVLDQVTPAAADALGVPSAGAHLRGLRARHLPGTWDPAAAALRCHPRFREYLLELLERRPGPEVREVRRRHGDLLAGAGHHEEAVGEYLAAGALEEALAAAGQCLASVIDRADLQLAARWLKALAPVRRSRRRLAAAELMLAVAAEDYHQAVDLADELAASGELEEVARASSRAGATMSWCYMHVGRLDRARAVLEATAPGEPRDAMLYCFSTLDDEPPGEAPSHALSGGSFDALVMRAHYYRGYFGLAIEHPLEGWAARAGDAWRIGALLDMGHTERALQLFESVPAGTAGGAWLSGVLALRLYHRLGCAEKAWQALRDGRTRIRRSGSRLLTQLCRIEEAELELRLHEDATAAQAVLTAVLDDPVGRTYGFVREQAQTRLGMALLRDGAPAEAAEHLRRAVDTGIRSDRIWHLPAAGVYLAEAEWRLGDVDAADRAADLAVDAARRQTSNHLLLEALHDFPGVLSRRLDAEAGRDSVWHMLGRTLPARRDPASSLRLSRVELAEFGRIAIVVDGEEVRPRIKKSYELLAYLVDTRAVEVTREQLLGALFDGRADASATAYLRQAVHKLRLVLPADVPLTVDAGRVRFGPGAVPASESTRFEDLFTEAAALRDEDRLAGLRRALEIAERGEYLPGIRSEWAEHRRSQLAQRAADARFEAAETAFALARLDDAEQLLAAVLRADPLREPAWRLAMRLADAVGDENRVLTTYRQCEAALGEIDAAPSAATRRLLASLHH